MPMDYLSTDHQRELEKGSGLTPGIIKRTSYFTALEAQELLDLGFGKEQSALVPALVVPIWFNNEVVTYQIKPDKPRKNQKGKPIKYETPAGSDPRIHVNPEIQKWIKDKSKDLYITEGVKKADAAIVYGFCCIALNGVWLFRDGLTVLADWDSIAIKGRRIFIAFDSDVMVKPEVQKALRRLAAFLKSRGALEVIPIVPAIEGFTGKLGLDDYFVNGGKPLALNSCARPDLLETGLPEIQVNDRHASDIQADALAAIIASNIPPTVFYRGDELVRVSGGRIKALGQAGARNRLSTVAKWHRLEVTKDGPIRILKPHAPKDICEHFMAEIEWPGIPEVIGVAKCPMLSPCGNFSLSPGYDPLSKYVIDSSEPWVEWQGSTKDAVNFLMDDILADFPFLDEASKANALGLMLLPMVRLMINQPTPLHLIDAPVQGSGKSMLARVLLSVTQGADVAADPYSDNEEELRKTIMTKLLSGRPYVFFDDVSGLIKSQNLNQVLTGNRRTDRLMGGMTEVTGENHHTWVITGNNATLSTDLTERTVWIRLDPKVPDPRLRSNFKHPDIEHFVADDRIRIVAALIAMVKKWLAEKPAYEGVVHGRYPIWSRVIGGILAANGIHGFMDNFDEMRTNSDPEEVSFNEFINRWWERFKDVAVKAGDLLDEWNCDEYLAGRLTGPTEQKFKQQLGYKLQKLRDRTFRYSGESGAKLDFESDGAFDLTVTKLGHSGGTVTYKLVKKTSQVPLVPLKNNEVPLTDLDSNRGTRGTRGTISQNGSYTRASAQESVTVGVPQSPRVPLVSNPDEEQEF